MYRLSFYLPDMMTASQVQGDKTALTWQQEKDEDGGFTRYIVTADGPFSVLLHSVGTVATMQTAALVHGQQFNTWGGA